VAGHIPRWYTLDAVTHLSKKRARRRFGFVNATNAVTAGSNCHGMTFVLSNTFNMAIVFFGCSCSLTVLLLCSTTVVCLVTLTFDIERLRKKHLLISGHNGH